MAESKYIVFEVGDIRVAKPGEFYMLPSGDVIKCLIRTDGPVEILRRIPADRMEVTVKPEPKAWLADGNVLHEWATGMHWRVESDRAAATLADNMNAVVARLRKLEGQVNRG